MHGLIVRKPYIDLILAGKKRWEIRRTNTRIRGRVALIWDGTVWGTVEIVDVLEIPVEELAKHKEHGISEEEVLEYGKGRKTLFAWVLRNPRRVKPLKISIPRGARIWVKIPKEVEEWLRSSGR